MLLPEFSLVEPGGGSAGTLALRDAFFTPQFFDDPLNVDRVLGGLATLAQEIDAHLVDDVRDFLFGPPGAGGFDLASLNIQRGRDHGLEDYNTLRQSLGLLSKEKFLTDGVLGDGVTPNGVTTDAVLAAALASVYDSVDDIDAWLGGLAEDPAPGSAVSELVGAGLIEQFLRLRDGDRFYYENDPLLDTAAIQAVIDLDAISLQEIIELNTLASFNVSNIFVIPEPGAMPLALLAIAWVAGCSPVPKLGEAESRASERWQPNRRPPAFFLFPTLSCPRVSAFLRREPPHTVDRARHELRKIFIRLA